MNNKVTELFGHASTNRNVQWTEIVEGQQCPFLNKKCFKTRKSESHISIGTCSVTYGNPSGPTIICPARLTERKQIFSDCLHLLTNHQPGNQYHLVPEVRIPGGNVDFFIVSALDGKVQDFVGIELQTMDTSGSVWPERQRLLRDLNVPRHDDGENSERTFGMNWKMTAKTILVQMHHKIQTFEHINKKLVLIVQDKLMDYMTREFKFSHLSNPAILGDPMQVHSYSLNQGTAGDYALRLMSRLSTDSAGIAACLGLQAEARIEYETIVRTLEGKMSSATLFTPF